jgi:aryl-alcohol dehydrogenase-like predicted oxidoreductase
VLAETELGCSVAQLAIAWCVKNPNVSTVLMGATNAEQLEENLAALSIVPKLDDVKMAKIEAIMGNKPDAWDAGFRAFETI